MKRIVSIIIPILVAVTIGGFVFYKKTNTKKQPTPEQNIIEARIDNLELKVLATGKIVPYTRVEINSPVSGRIEKILVDEGSKVKPGDVLAWISSEDRTALLDAARAKLESTLKAGDNTQIVEAERAYEIAQKAYRPLPITNSISGEVIARLCEVGQNVTPQKVLFVISDRLTAEVQVDETDIGKISPNTKAKITLDAFPEEEVWGQVLKIAKEGNLVSDVVVYNVLVEPIKVPPYWTSGMTANVEFFILKKDSALLIPKSAIIKKNTAQYVYVLSGNKPEMREIGTGLSDGRNVEVISGLKEGEKIVLLEKTPQRNLPPGTSFQRMQQMMRSIR
jgi:macrolide-specific efflux system membrane fusion protein